MIPPTSRADDEKEMRRLCSMLEAVDGMLPESSPLREALVKGALAIQFAFARGRRSHIDEMFATLQDPQKELTQEQMAKLRELGIDPEE